MTLEELKVIITAETSGLKKELNSLQTQLNKTQAQVNKSTNKISSGFKKMTKAVSFTAIAYGLVKFGKAAIEAASDIEEVQNVVEVAFGDMADKCDTFAQQATAQFGLSALQAKNYASTLMSMSNGMGVAQETGANMSIQLAGLAGDLASFRNVSQDVANTALQSVFTGETETLKKFGVVMTETNLSAYALSKGITKSYSEMSQAEKVMLRYSYVMNTTKDAQNDYARTSNNWANQVRLLKNQFTTLISVIGKGFIAVLNPVIQLLNKLLAVLISVANAAAKAFGGKEIKSANSSVADTAAQASDVASGYDNAQKSAKKLKRELAGFDQINTLSFDDGSSSSSSDSTSGTIDPAIAALGAESYFDYGEQFEGMSEQAEQTASRISQIFHKYFDNLPQLNITFDKEKAIESLKGIGDSILSVLAGLGSFVITIGINIANDLDLGKILNDILALVDAIGQLAVALLDILSPVLKDFYEVYISPILVVIGDIIDMILNTLTNAIKTVADFIKQHSGEITTLIEVIGAAVLGGVAAWKAYKAAVAFGNTISTLAKSLKKLATAEGLAEAKSKLLAIAQAALNTVMSLNPVAIVVTAIGALIAVFVLLWNKCDGFREFWINLWNTIKEKFATFSDWISGKFNAFGEWADNAAEGIKNAFKSIPEWFKNTFTTAWTNVKNVFSKGGKVFTGIKDGILNGLKAVINALISGINKVISIPFKGINAAFNKLRNISILGAKPFSWIKDFGIPQIPKLAKGGVATSATLAMIGEYAGASQNPEIVTPQSLLKETINSSNENVIDTLLTCTMKLIKAMQDNQVSIDMNSEGLFNLVKKESNSYTYRTGKSAFI